MAQMADYAFYLNRAREAAGLVSQMEAAFARDPSDRGMRVNLSTAIRMAERTERDLYSIAFAEQVDLVRYKLVRHVTDAFGLSGVSRSLELFQEAVTYVFEAVTGQPRERASLSEAARKESELQFGYSFAGSLGIVLVAPRPRDLFITNFDAVVKTIGEVFDVSDNYELRDAAKKIGPAAVRKLYEWSDVNYKAGYDLDLRWTNADSMESGRYLEIGKFRRLANLISLTSDIEERSVASRGTLVGFDSVYKTFHFVVPDGESYKGQLAADFPMHRDWTVNRMYDAKILSEVTTKFSTGGETTKHRLAALKQVDP